MRLHAPLFGVLHRLGTIRRAYKWLFLTALIFCVLPILVLFRHDYRFSLHQIFKDSAFHYCPDEDLTHQPVTRIVHQSWITRKLPHLFRFWTQSWRQCYPQWKFIFWTDESNRDLVVKHFPWFLERYDSLPRNIDRADAARYMYMYVFGGIYSDLDTECLRPFEHLLRNHSLVFGAMKGDAVLPEGHTQNSFMYSVPRHPFWLAMLQAIKDHSNDGRPEVITGPNALMKVISDYRRLCKDDVSIYPPSFFNPFSWMSKESHNCMTHGNLSLKQYLACREEFSTSFVIQYHAHSWE